jgi:hypothetical protein
MSLKKDGYEVEDVKSVCEEQEREKRARLSRVTGYSNMYGEEQEGFIPRNNVNERL